tara:strand:+ start:1765 stop:2430 length:666 start_codon:yes stop_codon:yes gene_type:complete
MKKIISFSLWGSDPKYCIGAIRNAELALKHYPDWICRFHIGQSTPPEIIEDLRNRTNTEIVLKSDGGIGIGTLWRFLDASDLSADVMISRDADSRLNGREAAAVSEWLQTDKSFHIMRDHPYHKTEILGGMWGVKNPFLGDMKHLISRYVMGDFWEIDQDFLREVIYPIIENNSLVHDEFFEKKPFPTKREGLNYVGKPFDADDSICLPDADEVLRRAGIR